MFYNARWYDSYLNRWIQPDVIIPDPGNVLDWDRFSYTRNSPLMYTDPSGNTPAGPGGAGAGCGSSPDDCESYHSERNQQYYYEQSQNELISWVLPGSGANEEWTASDWEYYWANEDNIWEDVNNWTPPGLLEPDPTGWAGFAAMVKRLASHYGPEEEEKFMRAFGLIFAGISSDGNPYVAMATTSTNRKGTRELQSGNQGLKKYYLDSWIKEQKQSHHYAAFVFTGYYMGANRGSELSIIYEFGNIINPGDTILGSIASYHGANFKGAGTYSGLVKAILGMME